MKPLQISICSLLAFAVAAHGAVEPWSRAVLETGVGILLVFWAVRMFLTQRDSLQISPLLPPLLGLALLAFGQLVFHTSVSAYDTRVELQLLVAYAVFLLLANQAFREPDDWRLFIWFA